MPGQKQGQPHIPSYGADASTPLACEPVAREAIWALVSELKSCLKFKWCTRDTASAGHRFQRHWSYHPRIRA